jgi:hypothetical protein
MMKNMTKSMMKRRWPRATEGHSQMIACSWEWGSLGLLLLSISGRSMMMRTMTMNNNIITSNQIMKEAPVRTTMIK